MSCVSPLKGFVIGKTENGKDNYKITPYRAKGVYKQNGKWRVDYDIGYSLPTMERYVGDYTEIPCGHCVECRLQYSRNWADRCMVEIPYHKYNYFITLTYETDNLSYAHGVNPDTGEILDTPTLVKKDLQDFIKRIRSYFTYQAEKYEPLTDLIDYSRINEFCYYAAGEYGEINKRPHYHMIAFDLPLDDLTVWSKTDNGIYYRSPTLEKEWNKGFVMVCEVSWETCAYVARYCMKKQKGEASMIYTHLGIEPEFSLMSRNPAIGKRFYLDHQDEMYNLSYISYSTEKGGKRLYPSRYFDKLYDVDNPDHLKQLKDERKYLSQEKTKGLRKQTTLDDLGRLHSSAIVKESQIKKLKRGI